MEQTPRATFPSVKRKKTTNQRPGNRNHSLIRHSNVWRHLIGPFQSDDDERLLLFFFYISFLFFCFFRPAKKKNKGRSYWPVDFFFCFVFFGAVFRLRRRFFFLFQVNAMRHQPIGCRNDTLYMISSLSLAQRRRP